MRKKKKKKKAPCRQGAAAPLPQGGWGGVAGGGQRPLGGLPCLAGRDGVRRGEGGRKKGPFSLLRRREAAGAGVTSSPHAAAKPPPAVNSQQEAHGDGGGAGPAAAWARLGAARLGACSAPNGSGGARAGVCGESAAGRGHGPPPPARPPSPSAVVVPPRPPPLGGPPSPHGGRLSPVPGHGLSPLGDPPVPSDSLVFPQNGHPPCPYQYPLPHTRHPAPRGTTGLSGRVFPSALGDPKGAESGMRPPASHYPWVKPRTAPGRSVPAVTGRYFLGTGVT